jgi:hypothetical protein
MRYLIAGTLTAIALLAAAPAQAVPQGIDISDHGVVLSSTLPACTIENGSSGPLPCTWNVGTQQTGGLSYWIGTQGNYGYVWDTSPLAGYPNRHWSTSRPRCYLDSSGIGHCPNGDSF